MSCGGVVRTAGPFIIIHANTIIAMVCGCVMTADLVAWSAVATVAPEVEVVGLVVRGVLLLAALTLTLTLLAPYALTPTPRPVALCLHALCHLFICVGVMVGGVCACRELGGSLGALEEAARRAGEVRRRLEDLLDALARYHDLPNNIKRIMREVDRQVPVAEGVAVGAAGVYLLMVLLTVITSVALAGVTWGSRSYELKEKGTRRPYLRPPRDLGPLLPPSPAPS